MSSTTLTTAATTTTVAVPAMTIAEPTEGETARTKLTTRLARWTQTLNALDERLSTPVFACGFSTAWCELLYSFPAHIFGSSFSVMVMPVWIATLAISSSSPGASSSDVEEQHSRQRAVMVLHSLTLGLTLLYFVAWLYFQHYQAQQLLGQLFYRPSLYLLGCPWNVAILWTLQTVLLPQQPSPPRMEDARMFSLALYPLFLFPPLVTIVNYLKKTTKRQRPAYKDWHRNANDKEDANDDTRKSSSSSLQDNNNATKQLLWTNKKKYPFMTELLAKYNGDASFPSGDAALATLFALPIYYIGSTTTNDDHNDASGSSRYYYQGIAVSIVVLSASGRMYVLAHHVLDVTVGILLSIGLHHLATLLGFGIDQMQWWYPLLTNGLYFGYEHWRKAKKHQSTRTKTDSATKKE
jgi:membrane-associated phospholipid phosphatase